MRILRRSRLSSLLERWHPGHHAEVRERLVKLARRLADNRHGCEPDFCLQYATKWLHIVRMSMDAVFHALADPVRRDLLDRLHAQNGQTLSELCEDGI